MTNNNIINTNTESTPVKMSIKDQAAARASLYEVCTTALFEKGYDSEPVCDGSLIHLPNGQFAVIKISIKDATKFNLEEEREKYTEKQVAAAERAEKAAEKARKKAEKAKEKAEKAKEKNEEAATEEETNE